MMMKTKLASFACLFFIWQISNAQCVNDPVTNLVVNGDFESGNKFFVSGYSNCNTANCLYPEGYYAVGQNANTYHGNFQGRDHTTGKSNFIIVNGTGVPNTIVWSQTISIKANTDYNFSSWVSSVHPSSPAKLQFQINGTTIGSIFSAPSVVNSWQNFFVTWNSGSNTSAVITILNQNTTLAGNDFGLDDISFIEICNTPIPDLGTNQALCGSSGITLDTKIPKNSTTTVTWSDGTTGTGNSAPYTKKVKTPGTYWVCVKDGACVKTDTVKIIADFSINLGPDFTLCTQSSFKIDAGYYNPATSFKWYKDNVLIPDSIKITFLVRGPGTYKVEVKDASCGITRTDEVVVSSNSASPNDGKFCPPDPAVLAVIPKASTTTGFKWYDSPTGGSVKGKGNSITVTGATKNLTMYAEDSTTFTYNVGPTSKFANGYASPATSDYIEFDAVSGFTLDAVSVWAKVWNPNETYKIGVKIYNSNGTVLATKVVTVIGPPIVPIGNDWPFTVLLGIDIPAGTGYRITNEGTVGDLFWASGSGNSVTWASYKVPGILTLKGMGSGFNYCYGNCFGFFYNWKLSQGNKCARVTVEARVNCVLPVQFVDFTAEAKSELNLLTWQTTKEIGVSYYSIQKSFDGKNFISAGNIKAVENSNDNLTYNFEDKNIHQSLIYYKIVEVDNNGSTTSTDVVKVEREKPLIQIFPNPTNGSCSVSVKRFFDDASSEIKIHNALGEEVLVKTILESEEAQLNLNHLPNGIYFVTIKGEEIIHTDKIIKY